MKYRVTATVTIGGTITIEAESKQHAEELLHEMMDEDEGQFLNHKTLDVHHREWDVIDVE